MLTKAPYHTKVSQDGFMYAEVHNLSDIRLFFENTQIPSSEWTQAERDFCELARQEAIEDMKCA